ncbi:uncharacterized protein LOC131614439 [Vicia villosa]|uniref:uncharacterized protein LOC131614439 n=1 Tax=Vicia villosa TaxID=3911 RepID=UPI00273B4C6F|nr:uncharacterized protein LOC131614439 [Vicia villosa]
MIIGSMNIRGGGNSLKRRRVNTIIKKGKADIFLIQETKIKEFKDFFAKSFWSEQDIGYSYSNALGASGGLLILWKEGKVEVDSSFRGDGYLGVKVKWENHWYYVCNVYSSCSSEKKKRLWEVLGSLKEKYKDGEWIIGGDFNAVKNRRERKGSTASANLGEMNLFADFIHKSSLVDIPCKGKKFYVV